MTRTLIWFKKNGELLLMALLFFMIPLSLKVVPPLLLIIFLISFKNYRSFRFTKVRAVYYTLPLFWLLHLFGFFFSENLDYWKLDIEIKVSLLLIPLLFLMVSKKVIENKNILIASFSLGVLTLSTLLIYQGYQCLDEGTYRQCFEGSRFASVMHTTYLATIFAFSIVGLWYCFLKFKLPKVVVPVLILLSLYFLYFIYQFYSIGPWVSILAFLSFLPFVMVPRKWLKWSPVLILIMLPLIMFLNKFELIESGVNAVTKEVNDYQSAPVEYLEKNKNDAQSVKARILLWSVAVDIVKKHPFGVGNGDTKDILISNYKSKGMDVYADKQLNPHNQYLQTTIGLGILGLLTLLISGLAGLIIAFKKRYFLMLSFFILYFCGMMFESMLEVQAGVIPFALFYGFFVDNYYKNQA